MVFTCTSDAGYSVLNLTGPTTNVCTTGKQINGAPYAMTLCNHQKGQRHEKSYRTKMLGRWGIPSPSPCWEPRCKLCKHGDPHVPPHAGPLLHASRAMQSTKPPGSRLRPPPAADALEKVGFVSKGDKQYVKHARISLGAVLTWVSQTTRLPSAARIL